MADRVCPYRDSRYTSVKCAGPWWVSKGYFPARKVGRDLYACEAHAKESMALNPFGSRFVPTKAKKS